MFFPVRVGWVGQQAGKALGLMQSLSFGITAQVAEAFLDCQAVQAGLTVKIQEAKGSGLLSTCISRVDAQRGKSC